MIRWIEERTGEPMPTFHEFGLGGEAFGPLPKRTFDIEVIDDGPFLREEEGREGGLFLGETATNGTIQADLAGDELG
jgi:hypothetical protein